MKNSEIVGKYVIAKDLSFSDYMKDADGNIKIFGTLEEACDTCGVYEFDDVIVMKIEHNHIERK